MPGPQAAQRSVGEIGQRQESILAALTTAHMHLIAPAIDIAHLQRKRLAETKSQRIGGQQEYPVAEFTGGTNQPADLFESENIGERLDLWRLDDLDPGPVAFKHVFVEKLQAITVYLDGAPGMRIDQVGEVGGQLLNAQMIGATIEVSRNPAQCTGIGIDGFVTQALKFQGPEMLLVQVVVSALFGWFHDKLLSVSSPGLGQRKLT